MGFWTFVLVAVAISTVATVINNWIRARHGYPLEEEQCSGRVGKQIAALCAENQDLRARLSSIEGRLRVMERIATDPTGRIESEIEKLRS